ncbi:MAG: glycoside hydrolase family 2 [Thermomicrobiales bacterium]|nr:glycoside hydrolase family 2 [Thermomicrobiales bacterium]
MAPDLAYPRPQFVRERWIDLNGPWGFACDDADIGLAAGWPERADVFDRAIIVPFPPESAASGIGERGFHPVVWYRRVVRLAPDDRREALLLHFGAVDYRAQVWVNGRLVARHEGGQTPFFADIASCLLPGDAEQVIVVRAEDRPGDLTQPRGKQDWQPEPHSIWYHRTTGIWQPVWLEPVPTLRLTDARWTPDLDRATLDLAVRLNRPPERPARLRVRLTLHDRPLADLTGAVDGDEIRFGIPLDAGDLTMHSDRTLWSPRHPNLVDAELTLLADDAIVDRVQSYAGLRSAGVANGRFTLNGRPYYPRLVLAQNYWPQSHLAAPNPAALRREVELAKSLGFNGVRIHQKVEDPRFLYWCDRLGMLVWGEMANAYVFSAEAVERLTREWLDVLRRDYSHPCIVTWVPLNESWGAPALPSDPRQRHYVRALHHLTHALDPTRPVIGNDGWEHLASDIWGIHDYAPDGADLRARYGSTEALEHTLRRDQPIFRSIALPGVSYAGEPVMLTEFGGIGYAPVGGERWYGYGTVTTAEAFLAKYRELTDAVLDSPAIAGFCYTQLTDTEQETNGLLTADRIPKLDPAALRAINQRPAAAVPGEIIAGIHAPEEPDDAPS